MISKNIFLLLVLYSGYLNAQETVVQIPNGQLRGRTDSTPAGTTFYTFQGIPYGQPPVGDLRFQAPQPAKPWSGVLDATQEGSMCYQIQFNYPKENEDCLFINVFTPRNPSDSSSLPVMFWIYGGAFLDGWSEAATFAPHHFMDLDVILVTSNYRVGPLGFLTTGDDVVPGNAGLKDQNLALQWVNKNIQYFGGDPEKVTIFGQSAGAASVSYQILSPKSKGLFRAAIQESGSALTPWAYQRDMREFSVKTAGLIDPSFNDNTNVSSSDLAEFLRGVPAPDIKTAALAIIRTEVLDNMQLEQGFYYAPVVEHDHPDAFITKWQYESFASGDYNDVPLLVGMNSGETSYVADDWQGLVGFSQAYDYNHPILVPHDMHIQDPEVLNNAAEEIKNLYTPNGDFADDPNTLLKYLDDQCFMRSIIKQADLQSRSNDVYYYQFSYSGVLGGQVSEPVEGFSNTVRHSEEINYVFAHTYQGAETTDFSKLLPMDALVFRRVVTMFTNFAKTLNPTPTVDPLLQNITWPKVNPTYFPYLDIGSYSQVRLHPRADTYDAWNALYDKYGVKPYDSY